MVTTPPPLGTRPGDGRGDDSSSGRATAEMIAIRDGASVQFIPTAYARTILGERGGFLNCEGCGAFGPTRQIGDHFYCRACIDEDMGAGRQDPLA